MNIRHVLLVTAFALSTPILQAQGDDHVTEGRLEATGPHGDALGPCPLKHTAVDAEISGTIARVTVTQQFHNPFREKIEALYVFPLHQDSAVDEMTMTVGDRIVKGVIKERGEAKRIYDDAKARGKVAALLDQERPNIFTQAVANIEPGQQVTITISYSQSIAWTDGRFGFDFPTVVGPRYIPGASTTPPDAVPVADQASTVNRQPDPWRGPQGEAPVVNPDAVAPSDRVPDANRITPPVVEEGYRAGHDLSITVRIQAGLPIAELKSDLHEITVDQAGGDLTRAVVTLVDKGILPNRDFSISYRTAGDTISDAVLTHTDERGKFFTLVLQPPARVRKTEMVPRELVFVLDTSGSMNGFPIETSKSMMRRAIDNLRPADCFNLVTFSGNTAVLFPNPVANTENNRHLALGFIDSLHGSGGTEMMKAINTALGGKHDPQKVRIACFLTDGYVGNDMEIVGAVRAHAGTTRVFSFGIGRSVNRFLLDSMAQAGRGEASYVLSQGDAEKTANKFYERIDAPVLTDIALDFGGLEVEEVYPRRIEDLFAAKPVVVKGRYTKAGAGVIKLKGRNATGAFERDIAVTFPEGNPDNRVLASQWARAKVGHLMMGDMTGMQQQQMQPELKNDIIQLGLTYNLLTQFTSFVAVEERHTTEGGTPRTVQVPLEMPQDVSYSGVFGGVGKSQSSRGFGGAGNGTSSSFGEMSALTTPSGGLGGSGTGMGMGFGAGHGTGKLFGLIPEAMSKRCSKQDRLQRLQDNGGKPECEEAVVKALTWLKQHQNKDGGWCASNQTTATAYALLAYLGHCETPFSEEYGETTLKAITFLLDKALKNQGRIADVPNDPNWAYGHAMATCALAEALVFTKELKFDVPHLEETVHNAGQWIIDHQMEAGGWSDSNATAGKDDSPAKPDSLLVCVNLQALKACSHTGIKFRGIAGCANRALNFIKTCQDADGAIGYAAKGDFTGVSPLAGAGACAYQTWGKASNEFTRKACDHVAKNLKFKWEAAGADLIGLPFNVQAMMYCGGKPWRTFNAMFLPEVLKARNPDGSFKDTAAAAGDTIRPPVLQLHGTDEAAIHFRTCLATLTLEVYYRYLSVARPPES